MESKSSLQSLNSAENKKSALFPIHSEYRSSDENRQQQVIQSNPEKGLFKVRSEKSHPIVENSSSQRVKYNMHEPFENKNLEIHLGFGREADGNYDNRIKSYVTSPPKMNRKKKMDHDEVEPAGSVVSLAFSNDPTDYDDDTANGTTSQCAVTVASMNTSGGAASSVCGYKFLPTESAESETDVEDQSERPITNFSDSPVAEQKKMQSNEPLTSKQTTNLSVNTSEGAPSNVEGYRFLPPGSVSDINKQKDEFKSESVLKPKLNERAMDNKGKSSMNKSLASSKDPRISIKIDNDDEYKNHEEKNLKIKAENLDDGAEDTHPTPRFSNEAVLEDCDSIESVMGSDFKSQCSSAIEGTVIGNETSTMTKRRKSSSEGKKSNGITAELLRAMQEENDKASNEEAGTLFKDAVLKPKTPPKKINEFPEPKKDAINKARRKKNIFPMTSPVSKSISPIPHDDLKQPTPPALVLPPLEAMKKTTSHVKDDNFNVSGYAKASRKDIEIIKEKHYADAFRSRIMKKKSSLTTPSRPQRVRQCISLDFENNYSPLLPSTVQHQQEISLCQSWDTAGHDELHHPFPNKADAFHNLENSFRKTEAKNKKAHLIETERDDALSLLSYLVDRTMSLHHNINGNETKFDRITSSPEKNMTRTPFLSKSSYNDAIIQPVINAFSSMSRNFEGEEKHDSFSYNHELRMKVLEDLVSSHLYALDMKSAAAGASKWLSSLKENGILDARKFSHQTAKKQSECHSFLDHTDIIEIQSKLVDTEKLLEEQIEYSMKLDEELCKCRAEIGRLKSAARAEVLFTSPNRSILDFADDDDESSSFASTGVKNEFQILENVFHGKNSPSDVTRNNEQDENHNFNKLEGIVKDKEKIVLLTAEIDHLRNQIKQNDMKDDIESNTEDDSARPPKDAEVGLNEDEGILEIDVDERNEERDENSGKFPDTTNTNDTSAVPFNGKFSEELEAYKEALVKAQKSEIMMLRQELKEMKSKKRSSDAYNSENTKTYNNHSVLANDLSSRPQIYDSTDGIRDEKTMNMKSVDSDNFVTEWTALDYPLPPPPDHNLRSPIVEALLAQWTPDFSMHNSLLSWMDQVLEGADPLNVPPLQIASLDHQVRDGFVTHVLPILLRRSDISVELTTRTHRITSYDIAVGVTSVVKSTSNSSNTEDNARSSNSKHIMAFKASYGSGIVNENVPKESNKTLKLWKTSDDDNGNSSLPTFKKNSEIEVAGYRNQMTKTSGLVIAQVGNDTNSYLTNSAEEICQNPSKSSTPGFMSALGGAFGGLLTMTSKTSAEKKTSLKSRSFDEGNCDLNHQNVNERMMHRTSPSSRTLGSQTTIQSQANINSDHPYHRVASAPPGRIGVTFVQFRGHAMVSYVDPHSPLQGWVFPSDILIAIDEVPVSGMRVRDIVKLLTARTERQRALRVISTHAMNELTMPD